MPEPDGNGGGNDDNQGIDIPEKIIDGAI